MKSYIKWLFAVMLPASIVWADTYPRGDLQGYWEQTSEGCKGCRIQIGSNKFEVMVGKFVHLKGKYADVFNQDDFKWKIHGETGPNRWRLQDLVKRFRTEGGRTKITGERYVECEVILQTQNSLEVRCEEGSPVAWKRVAGP